MPAFYIILNYLINSISDLKKRMANQYYFNVFGSTLFQIDLNSIQKQQHRTSNQDHIQEGISISNFVNFYFVSIVEDSGK